MSGLPRISFPMQSEKKSEAMQQASQENFRFSTSTAHLRHDRASCFLGDLVHLGAYFLTGDSSACFFTDNNPSRIFE